MTLRPDSAVLALDVGGTTVKGALVGPAGLLHRHTAPTAADDGPDAAVAALLAVCHELLGAVPDDVTVRAVGVAAPGTVDEAAGVVHNAENLGWRDLPLRALLTEALGLPVRLGHDVRAGGLAEWRLGAGRGSPDLAFLPIGTGIAAALVLEGRLVSSAGMAGEVGHGGRTRSETAELPCPCGGRGCAETYASAAGISRRYAALTGQTPGPTADVVALAAAGEAVATRVWSDATAEIATVVADLVRVTGVSLVVIGGGLVGAGAALLEPVRAGVRDQLTVHRVPRVVPAQLGADAGMHGAALIAQESAA